MQAPHGMTASLPGENGGLVNNDLLGYVVGTGEFFQYSHEPLTAAQVADIPPGAAASASTEYPEPIFRRKISRSITSLGRPYPVSCPGLAWEWPRVRVMP